MADPDMESVLAQMADDYVSGAIDLETFEKRVENRLRGITPMRDGLPIYYEYEMLNNTGLYYVA